GQDNYVLDPALQAIQSGQEIPWKEAIDPNSYQIYYYNTQTGETKWERPVELGPAPHATGWFGRGQSGTMAAQMYSQRNAMYLSRPARKQKEFIDPKNYHLEGANEYNIWYGRFLGDHWEQGAGKDKAADRCVLDKDAGYTKADKIVTEKETIRKKDKRFFCAHEAALWKHFGEWGELENVNVIQRLSIAFVRFRVRTSAEFAKEAMANQSLDQGEILDIRWAHDDPNPVAQDAIGRADKDALFALMQAKGISMESTGFQYPAEYSLPAAKRIRLENGVDLLQQHPDLAYPDTDVQYGDHGHSYQQIAAAGSSAADGSSSAGTGAVAGVDGEVSGAPGDWEEFVDDESGATYFYNSKTGESSWGQAPPTASS
ncbi:cwc2, partial [Symbiodinium microadriaticum]